MGTHWVKQLHSSSWIQIHFEHCYRDVKLFLQITTYGKLQKKKAAAFSSFARPTLKAFVKLECCFLNRIKAQIFFLCSQIDIQQPIKADRHFLGTNNSKKCLMSEELLVAKRRAAQDGSPLLSLVIRSCSDCWWWHYCHRMRKQPGTASASTTRSSFYLTHATDHITKSLCSIKAIKAEREEANERPRVWAEAWQDVSKTRAHAWNKQDGSTHWSIFGKSCSG